MLKGVIFDLDGTLLDSMWIWEKIDRDFAQNHNLPFSEEYHNSLKGKNFAQCAEITIEKYSLSDTPQALMDEWDRMAREEYENSIPPKKGAVEFVKKLHSRGIKIGVATSSYESLYKPCLTRIGIYDLFDSFTESHISKKGKSDPTIYLTEAEKLGCAPSECAVFEDIIVGIRTASGAGFTTFGVFDDGSAADEADIRSAADYFTYDFSDIDISLFGGQ